MNRFVLTALFGAFISMFIDARAGADAVPKKYLGTYQGISLEDVANGESFERSTTRLRVTNRGLNMLVHVDDKARAWERHYPVDWIVAGKQPCLGILRDASAPNVSFVLCLKELMNSRWPELAMLTPQGLRLGEYVRETRAVPPQALKWLMRDRFDRYRQKLSSNRAAAANAAARKIMEGADDDAKRTVLTELRRSLADRPESEIPEVMAIVELALFSPNPTVQIAGVNVIAGAGLFTHALGPLQRLAERHADLHPDLLSLVTRTLGGLVHEANLLFQRRDAYARAFGTLDVDEMYRRTGGVIAAGSGSFDELEIFNLYPGPSRAWTSDLRERALGTLDQLARRASTNEARREAVDVISINGVGPVPKRERCDVFFN